MLLSISIPIPGTPFHRQMEAEGRIFDHDLAHYDGDHLVFQPKYVSTHEVADAFRIINGSFYSWKAILRRWWRFASTYLKNGKGLNWWLGALLRSYVFFKLSIFQRHHALERVMPAPPLATPAGPNKAGRASPLQPLEEPTSLTSIGSTG